jgi:hypothetical protein
MVTPNICGTSEWNLAHITCLVPRILRWLQDFWKIFALLALTFLMADGEVA